MRVDKQNLNSLDWAKMDNLVPCVVQHVLTGEVLMLGYMNDKALPKINMSKTLDMTLLTKFCTFCSLGHVYNHLN